jgi:acetylornithine/succinyldiaminopimelate/putrescine aminotransferase/acyl-coenzyme A synthetase/AMP-(fatty) acid ligase/predicted amino acid dehydrogenase
MRDALRLGEADETGLCRRIAPRVPAAADGVEVLSSATPLPAVLPVRSLAELLLRGRAGADPSAPILLGTIGEQPVDLGLGQLRSLILDLSDAFATKGLGSGQTVCLLRPPRTSELALGLAYAALTAMGVRVLLPMYTERPALHKWLGATEARTVVWCAREVRETGTEADRLRLESLERQLERWGASAICVYDDLDLEGRVARARLDGPPGDDLRLRRLMAKATTQTDCLVLTTSGSSGESKLVAYAQKALLTSCASWEAARLYREDRLGGRGLCLLFSHSMGVRAFWNALWTGRPLCLIPPEWFFEHPERVRTLLQRMQPEHVTGGPAVYRALLELIRVFPDLKENGLGTLRCLVSSGAPFDEELARRIEAALGLKVHNALGTTETMQVLSTVLTEGEPGSGMGAPLPGVRVALEPTAGPKGPCRLLLHSPFGFSGYIPTEPGRPFEPAPYWYATGDLVERSAGRLVFVGREGEDFVKDGFGVKVSRALLAQRYANLGEPVVHLEWFPLREEPGLGALLFLDDQSGATTAREQGLVTDRSLLRRIRGLIEARHESFLLAFDEFELRHFTISRFACLAGPPPRTSKGNVSRAEIARSHGELVTALLDKPVKRPGLVRLDTGRMQLSNSTRFVRPRLGRMLQLLRLDKEYVSGRGDRLVLREKGGTSEVVDFVGGFGATLLGHRHLDVIAAVRRFLDGEGVPFADQGSDRPQEGAFARRLAQMVSRITGGSYVVRLGSTGAEAVEIALAHAFLEREEKLNRFVREQRRLFGSHAPERVDEIARVAEAAVHGSRPRVLALAGAFHGQSQGARAVSELRKSRKVFAPMAPIETVFVPQDGETDIDGLVRDAEIPVPALAWQGGVMEERTVKFSRIIAAIAEPIRGEGGVHVVKPALLSSLSKHEFPLILDEIQCGLGRSGRFLASGGVRGHYYLLGKSLGGGVAKISAVLIDRGRYVERFDEYYHGTFAGDAFSCTAASAVLDVIERDDVPAMAAERGVRLGERLEKIRTDFPCVIGGIEGVGLMLGVELRPAAVRESALLRAAFVREHLGLIAASYLLNKWSVRVLPTLSAPNTLRLEPSAFIDDAAIEQLERGLRSLCSAIAERDLSELLGVLVEKERGLEDGPAPGTTEREMPRFSGEIEPPAPDAVRIAFLNHFILPERELTFLEPSLGRLNRTARRALLHRLTGLMDLEPSVLFARNLFGGRVWFASILLPASASDFEELHRSGLTNLAVRRIQEALEMGKGLGCSVGGLGAYTSIVTDDGLLLQPPAGMKLSTGNAFTAAVGVHRVLRLCRRRGIDPGAPTSRLGILGASGNIGTGLAHRMAKGDAPFRHMVLVGRRVDRLQALADSIRQETEGLCHVEISTSLSALQDCNVITAATGTNEPLLYPRHLSATKPVLLADLSVPSIVASAVRQIRNVQIVPLAGRVPVPGTPDFAMASHIPTGTAFACAGESMLLALAPSETRDLTLVGPLRQRSVDVLEGLAVRFGLLEPTSPLAEREVGG